MKKTFEHEDQRFLYDLDVLPVVAYRRAHSVYLFQSQVIQNPPSTWREYEASGAADADERAFAHLLIELDEEGDPKPYRGGKSAETAQKFLNVLPAKYRHDLEECRKDFFEEAGLLNIVSLKQLGALYGASTNGAAASTLFRHLATMTSSEIDELSSSVDSSNESSSTSPESSTDDSSSETPTAPTTTGPSDSSPEEHHGRSTESE